MKIKELKLELKSLAQEIRQAKSTRKTQPNGFVPALEYDRRNYRIKHIAYCLARGRTIDQIEAKVSDQNQLTKWDMEKIEKLVTELTFVEGGPSV